MKKRFLIALCILMIASLFAGCMQGTDIGTGTSTSVSMSLSTSASISVSKDVTIEEEKIPDTEEITSETSVSEEVNVSAEEEKQEEVKNRVVKVAFQNDTKVNIYAAIQHPVTGEQVVLPNIIEPEHTFTIELDWDDQIEYLFYALYDETGVYYENSASKIDMTKVESHVCIILLGENTYESFDVKVD